MAFVGLGMSELMLLMFLGGMNPGSMPTGLPPLPADKTLLSALPEECLAYAGWYGTAEPKSTSKNHVERLLAEQEVRHFVTKLWNELGDAVQRDAFHLGAERAEIVSKNVLPLAEIVLTRPGAMFLSSAEIKPGDFGIGGVDARGGVILGAGPKAETLRGIIARFEELVPPRAREELREEEVEGVKFKKLPMPPAAPSVMYGFSGEYFIIAVGEGSAEKIVKGLKTSRGPPKWLAKLHERLPVERPASVSYINIQEVAKLAKTIAEATPAKEIVPRVLEVTGLDGVKSVSSVCGLGETDYVAKYLLATKGKPRGLLNLISDKPLTAADLAAVPRDASWLIASRFDLAAAYKQIVDIVAEFNPTAKETLEEQLEGAKEQLGFHPVRDLLEALGDTQIVYSSPGEGGMLFGATAVISLRSRDKLSKVNDVLLKLIRAQADEEAGPSVQTFAFQGQNVFVLDAGRGLPIAPAWCLTEKQLVIGLYPQAVKAYLGRKSGAGSLADQPDVAALLKDKPISVMYQDTPELIRAVYPLVQMAMPMAVHEMRRLGMKVDASLLPSGASIYPHLRPTVSHMVRRDDGIYSEIRQSLPGAGSLTSVAPIAVALLLPAVQATREAGRRAASSNNLKQLALAMHNFHDVHGALPAPANTNDDRKPLLSWRVHVLPYIEQGELYKKFKLDEPWDSKHNKELIKEMPAVYKVPGGLKVDDGKTCYLVPTGDDTMFPPGAAGSTKGLTFAAITDGTSNTIMIVEAAPEKAVIWTKPDDWEFNPDKPLKGLVGHRPTGFLAAMGDGSVRTISKKVEDDTLKKAFTRAGGEVFELP